MFDDKALLKYLRESGYPAQWANLADDLAGADEARARQLVTERAADLGMSELLQIDEETAAADLSSHTVPASDMLQRLAQGTSGDRANAEKVQRALAALETISPSLSLNNPQFVALVADAETASQAEQAKKLAASLAREHKQRGALSDASLQATQHHYGLRESMFPLLEEELARHGITVAKGLPPVLARELDREFSHGIMELIRPENYQVGAPKTSYSVFDTDVTLAELDAALAYFDRNPDHAGKKNVARKIRSKITSDKQLRDAVVAYHLDQWEGTKRGALVADVVDTFKRLGVADADIRKFTGEGSRPQRQPQPRPRPQPRPQPRESGENATWRATDRDREHYGPIDADLQAGRLMQAAYRLSDLQSRGIQPATNVGRAIVTAASVRAQKYDAAMNAAVEASKNNDLERADRFLAEARELCIDSPDVEALTQELERQQRDPDLISSTMARFISPVGSEGTKRILGIFPEDSGGGCLSILLILLGGLLTDVIFLGPALGNEAPGRFFWGALTLAITGVVGFFASAALPSLLTFVLGVVLSYSLVADGYWASAFALLVLMSVGSMFRYNAALEERASEWNALLDQTQGYFEANGVMQPIAGLYFNGTRIFPPQPPVEAVPGSGLYLVDLNRNIVDQVPPNHIRKMAESKQLKGVNLPYGRGNHG